ncbi:T9SS type A sorting domain-containing protein, partial [candidate division WOR-3 bacterium]|nr:T9SS type A sorting domain-containing protein [candidate division WOR-3 bacterium]
MKLVSKIIVLLMVWVVLISAQSVIIDQLVRNLPIVNAAGCHWAIYDLDNAESRVCYENGIACVTVAYAVGLFWSAEIGFNFPSPVPEVGDSLLVIGSWDSAYVNDPDNYGSNSNHTGFYWLYSDTLDDPHAIEWRDDTLRPLPKPIATQVGWPTGNILISITNPKETRYTGQSVYDVLGFWIWADTTSGTHNDTAGRPDYFDLEVGFFLVDGDPGQITICTHSDAIYHDEQTVYWAYKLVARPSFSLKGSRQAPGHTTHYFSQNSNPLTNIGIEENTNSKPGCVKLEISPNPFTDRTDIRFQITENQMQDVRSKNQEASLEIYDCSGRLVKSFNLTSVILLHASAVPWYGTDESGEQLPSGVYFVQAKGGDL